MPFNAFASIQSHQHHHRILNSISNCSDALIYSSFSGVRDDLMFLHYAASPAQTLTKRECRLRHLCAAIHLDIVFVVAMERKTFVQPKFTLAVLIYSSHELLTVHADCRLSYSHNPNSRHNPFDNIQIFSSQLVIYVR